MLNFISTPIGNLNDISQRAIDAIRTCDYLYAEDTRVTQKLLKFINIKKECKSLHEHNETKVTKRVSRLQLQGPRPHPRQDPACGR